MKDWLKGLVLLVLGNVFYSVIPVWITEYLLSLPNPLNSVGIFFQSIGTFFQNLRTLNFGAYSGFLDAIKQLIGLALIVYAVYLILRAFYNK
jgi:hypothetical protein